MNPTGFNLTVAFLEYNSIDTVFPTEENERVIYEGGIKSYSLSELVGGPNSNTTLMH